MQQLSFFSSEEPSTQYLEQKLQGQGFKYIAGVDIQGMGAIAGPHVLAACILRAPLPPLKKPLSKTEQDALYALALGRTTFGVSLLDIEKGKSLLRSLQEQIEKLLLSLSIRPDFVLINGACNFLGTPSSRAVLQGPHFSQVIAYAELLASHTRRAIMEGHDARWPSYGLKQNQGYPTREHKKRLQTLGPSPIHH